MNKVPARPMATPHAPFSVAFDADRRVTEGRGHLERNAGAGRRGQDPGPLIHDAHHPAGPDEHRPVGVSDAARAAEDHRRAPSRTADTTGDRGNRPGPQAVARCRCPG
jgi:hypothetical protein